MFVEKPVYLDSKMFYKKHHQNNRRSGNLKVIFWLSFFRKYKKLIRCKEKSANSSDPKTGNNKKIGIHLISNALCKGLSTRVESVLFSLFFWSLQIILFHNFSTTEMKKIPGVEIRNRLQSGTPGWRRGRGGGTQGENPQTKAYETTKFDGFFSEQKMRRVEQV